MADIELFKLIKNLGTKIDAHTGYIDGRIQLSLQEQGHLITVNPLFDRRHQFVSVDQGIDDVSGQLKKVLDESELIIISQSFLGDAEIFNTALSRLLSQGSDGQKWLRNHNHIRDAEKFRSVDNNGVLCLPTTSALEQHIKFLNPHVHTAVLPCFISPRFNSESCDVLPGEVRDNLGLTENDFIIFQPTRVDPRKRIGKSIYLSAMLQKRLSDRKVVLLVAGGNELGPVYKEEKARLINYSKKLGFDNLVFLDGLQGDRKFCRVADYMKPGVANLVTFMSGIDAFGIPPLECSMVGVPCVTSSFKDEMGYSAFDFNYGSHGFSFILDDEQENFVNEGTLEKATAIAMKPSMFDEDLAKNKRLAEEKYGEENMKKTLSELLNNSGIT